MNNFYPISDEIARSNLRGTKRVLLNRRELWYARTYNIYYERYKIQKYLFNFFLPEFGVQLKRKIFRALPEDEKEFLKKNFRDSIYGFYKNLVSVRSIKKKFFSKKNLSPLAMLPKFFSTGSPLSAFFTHHKPK
jgi:hypothetical protein